MLQDSDKPDKPLSDMVKRLLARLLSNWREARRSAGGEDERQR